MMDNDSGKATCPSCRHPYAVRCGCDAVSNPQQFCDATTSQMAKLLQAIADEGAFRDQVRMEEGSSRRGVYLGYAYMWMEFGKEIARLPEKEGRNVREMVMWLYDGMLTEMRRRLGEWRTDIVGCEDLFRERRKETKKVFSVG